MNKKIMLFFMTSLISLTVSAYEIKNTIYAELSDMNLRNSSILNIGNALQFGEFNYLLRETTELKSNLSENANGVIKLQMDYNPASYNKNNTLEKIFIKEMYIDITGDFFNCRIGKQYLKWGDPVFFNNIDIINMHKDPLRPASEAEGNPFIDVSIPIQSFADVELITLFNDNSKKKIQELPLILKSSISLNNFGAFGFSMFEENKKPIYGLDVNYTGTINQESDYFVYTTATLKNETNISKVNENGIVEINKKDAYSSFTGGGRLTVRFPYWKRFDRVDMVLEYSFDDENWSNNEYKNFCDLQSKSFDLKNLLLYRSYKNSKSYLFAGATVSNVVLNDLQYDFNLITNLEDISMFCVNSFKYQYTESMTLGIKYYLAVGGERSEFGNSINSNEIQVNSEISF